MSLRFATLLGLYGLAACSNHAQENTAKDATYENEPTRPVANVAASDPAMRPASLEPTDPLAPTSASGATHRERAHEPRRADATPAPSTDAPAAPLDPAAPSTQPDNTKVNERDTKSNALTPMDQGNGAADLQITQQIRKAVMADSSLSFTAKNVKIISNGGKVTLRGPVSTEQERARIEAAARKVAGVANVDNQLEVKK